MSSELDRICPHFTSEEIRGIERASAENALQQELLVKWLETTRHQLGIELVYYPGCFDDETLSTVFKDGKVVHLDKEPEEFQLGTIKGDFNNSPFRDDTFDAIYIKDIHAGSESIDEFSRVLKVGGIIIHNKDGMFGEIVEDEIPLLNSNQRFQKIEMLSRHKFLNTYRKIR